MKSIFTLAVLLALPGCGGHARELTLHAPEHRILDRGKVETNTKVLCMTHGGKLEGRVPAVAASNATSGADYDGERGGSLSIEALSGGAVTLTCT